MRKKGAKLTPEQHRKLLESTWENPRYREMMQKKQRGIRSESYKIMLAKKSKRK